MLWKVHFAQLGNVTCWSEGKFHFGLNPFGGFVLRYKFKLFWQTVSPLSIPTYNVKNVYAYVSKDKTEYLVMELQLHTVNSPRLLSNSYLFIV